LRSRTDAALVLAAAFAGVPICARAAVPSTADLDAVARAAGNRPGVARAIGQRLFNAVWPAQLTKIRVDGIGNHAVAGLLLSGVKFHGALDRNGFEREIASLVAGAFAAAPIEEVDVWATVPIPYDKREPVTGDYAQPVSRIVFAVTCTRGEVADLAGRLRSGRGVYWAPDFLRRLEAQGSPMDPGQG
jgi:hypothetical protein